MFSKTITNGIEVLTIETAHLSVSMVPALGGKILSLFNKPLNKEFLWVNTGLPLQLQEPGADYDLNFLGGIDELIPNDLAETIDGLDYPDHGELWTTPLEYSQQEDSISVTGVLPRSGLQYSKTVRAQPDSPALQLTYTIKNTGSQRRHFLWKLHAALAIAAGDRLTTTARRGQVVDPAYSRFSHTAAFDWPWIEGTDAAVVPPKKDGMDFFYLFDVPVGEIQLLSNGGKHVFSYQYDANVFPYQWYFASYGGFYNHYTAILEPCTNMPISVTDAMRKAQCALLEPGETLHTTVRIYAGEKL